MKYIEVFGLSEKTNWHIAKTAQGLYYDSLIHKLAPANLLLMIKKCSFVLYYPITSLSNYWVFAKINSVHNNYIGMPKCDIEYYTRDGKKVFENNVEIDALRFLGISNKIKINFDKAQEKYIYSVHSTFTDLLEKAAFFPNSDQFVENIKIFIRNLNKWERIKYTFDITSVRKGKKAVEVHINETDKNVINSLCYWLMYFAKKDKSKKNLYGNGNIKVCYIGGECDVVKLPYLSGRGIYSHRSFEVYLTKKENENKLPRRIFYADARIIDYDFVERSAIVAPWTGYNINHPDSSDISFGGSQYIKFDELFKIYNVDKI